MAAVDRSALDEIYVGFWNPVCLWAPVLRVLWL